MTDLLTETVAKVNALFKSVAELHNFTRTLDSTMAERLQENPR